jgi:acetyl-CoA carboxylase biotin carboxyl carrier protein
MTSITQDDVLFILKLLDESPFDELQIEYGDLKLRVKKQGKLEEVGRGAQEDQKTLSTPLELQGGQSSLPQALEGKGTPVPPPPVDDATLAEKGLIPIRAPMLGTFYRTPKPGAPPFVEVGSFVEEDDPVCIIEVMKLFNTVRAGVRGRIAKICAEQGQMVEFQQTLFWVEKANGKGPSKGKRK